MPGKAAENIATAPYSEVLLIILDFFRPLLAEQGLGFDVSEARDLAAALAKGRSGEPTALEASVAAIVAAQLARLNGDWRIDFAACLRADLSEIADWQTTAEFLRLANAKAQAESQIALGSALMVAAGRHEFVSYLVDVIAHDAGAGDVDALIASRVLREVESRGAASLNPPPGLDSP